MPNPEFLPYSFQELSIEDMKLRAASFREEMQRRRSIRFFADRTVPKEVIVECLRTAGTAPSGANLQPWHFVAISDPDLKFRIRQEAEKEEREFYRKRATSQWLSDLSALGTNEEKAFLDSAPYLIAVFSQTYRLLPDGKKVKNYYVTESVGIATGFLVTAVHHAGLACLTHTPSPMGFLGKILNRPLNEKPYLILVVGYPAEDAVVPQIGRKPLEEISTFL